MNKTDLRASLDKDTESLITELREMGDRLTRISHVVRPGGPSPETMIRAAHTDMTNLLVKAAGIEAARSAVKRLS